MKLKNSTTFVLNLFILFNIALNFVGSVLAKYFELPMWLDSLGTMLTAYSLGPTCGALVGACLNVMNAIVTEDYYLVLYAFVSAFIAIIVGWSAKFGYMDNLFGVLSTGFLVTIVAAVGSTPISVIYGNGLTGKSGAMVLLIYI